jgi:uncharacterized protein (TIGR00730 family)
MMAQRCGVVSESHQAPLSGPERTMTPARPRIAVYGSSTIAPAAAEYRLARTLGAELARGGADVMTGGYSGVMEAASRGAAEAGGHVIGVTVQLLEERGPVNAWVSQRIHTPDLFERLRVLVNGADGFIAVAGHVGTLAEVFLTWTLLSAGARAEAPLVLLGDAWPAWIEAQRQAGFVSEPLMRHVALAGDVPAAVRLALGQTVSGPSVP